MSEWHKSEIVDGARKLLTESLKLEKTENLVILSHDRGLRSADFLIQAAQSIGIHDVLLVRIPEVTRPLKRLPPSLSVIPAKASAIVYLNDRIPEEYLINRDIGRLCQENHCKYTYIVDPEERYFLEGIAADYKAVEDRSKRIKAVLSQAERINVTSKLGTSLEFRIYEQIGISSPLVLPNQQPEGECYSCPIEESFSGTMVVDGPVGHDVGRPLPPVKWEFEKGKTVKVDGDKQFLANLLKACQVVGDPIKSLIGIWIAEFSIGANQWAILDSNMSNCEKVAGTIHFAMGRTTFGAARGEKYHFDNILTKPTVVATKKDGEKQMILDSGHLLI